MTGENGPGTLGVRLAQAREAAVIGRRGEEETFLALLGAPEPAILWVHAPGGTGKSTLLRRWEELARERGRAAARADLQVATGTPDGIRQALARSLTVAPDDLAQALLDAERPVLFFDTWELGATVDGWVREALLPSLPDGTLVVVASREPPSAAWTDDAGWRALLRELPLANLEEEDAHALLAQRGVAVEQRDAIVSLTRGHALALTLVAEVQRQAPDVPVRLAESPELLRELVDRFVRHVPSPAHRDALRVCARVRFTTESVLRAVVDDADPGALFDWLRALPFVVESPRGLRPHALARDVLEAEFRWRDPEAFARLHRRLHALYLERMRATVRPERDAVFWDLLYLGRIDPSIDRYIAFEELGSGWQDVPRPDEEAELVRLAERIGGPAVARVARHWLARRPEAFVVVRSPLGEPIVLSAHFTLDGFEEEDLAADPALVALRDFVEGRGGLAPGEKIVLSRFMLVPRTPELAQMRNNTPHMLWLTTPGIAYAFSFILGGDHWEAPFARVGFRRLPELEARLDEPHGVFFHDWRGVPPDEWAAFEAEQELAGGALRHPALVTGGPPTLPREEVESAVRDALRAYTQRDVLADNPLVGARCTRGGGVDALVALLDDAVAVLGGHPRDEKLQRALRATYLSPAPTQEAAAERLELPFSTYRRHLTKGIGRVVEHVWRRELG